MICDVGVTVSAEADRVEVAVTFENGFRIYEMDPEVGRIVLVHETDRTPVQAALYESS